MANLSETIRARHVAAVARAAELRSQLDTVMQECGDLEAALKSIEELEGNPGKATGQAESAITLDLMSMPQLILLALEEGPMLITEVTALVSRLSNEPVDASSIRLAVWRMWKTDRIARTGNRYHLLSDGPTDDDDADEIVRKFFS